MRRVADRGVVLIVEDDAGTRALFQELIAADDYDLVFAVDGRDGLRLAHEKVPDIILLDVLLPDVDGFEVCRQFRRTPQLAEVPIVIITVLEDRESRLEGLRAGADDFLSKPIDWVELRARLQTLTRLNRFRHLLAERTRTELLLERSRDGYVLLDEHDRLLYANPRARSFLGIPPDAPAPAEPFHELARRSYDLQPHDRWRTWPRETAPERYLVRRESATAPPFWVRVEELPPGNPRSGRLVELRDVSRQVLTQRDMLSFQSAISHKLRSPLNGIVGSLEILAEEAASMSGGEVARFASLALRSAVRLLGEVEGVLRYTHVRSMIHQGEPCTVDELATRAHQAAADLGIEIGARIEPAADGNRRLVLPGESIDLLFRELFENAKKFHPRQAPSVDVSAVVVDHASVRLTVRDDGLHLTPAQLDRVLMPYEQSHKQATSGEVPGLGLGLALVAIVVWSAGGSIRVYNRPDAPGLVVDLTVPLAR